MAKTTIYITADNIISPLGFTSQDNVEKISRGQTGVKCHSDKAIYPSPVWVSKISDKLLNDAVRQLSNWRNYTKLEQLFLLSISKASQQVALNVSSKDTLIIIASTKGNINLLENPETMDFPKNRVQLGTMAGQIQAYFKNPNTPLVIDLVNKG